MHRNKALLMRDFTIKVQARTYMITLTHEDRVILRRYQIVNGLYIFRLLAKTRDF